MISPRAAAGCVAALAIAGCASVREGQSPIKEVAIVAPVSCQPALGPSPAYPDTDDALRAAPSLFSRVQLLVAGRLLRLARQRELEAALAACAAPLTFDSDPPHS